MGSSSVIQGSHWAALFFAISSMGNVCQELYLSDYFKDFFGVPDQFSPLPEQFFGVPEHFSCLPEQFFGVPDHFFGLPEQISRLPVRFFHLPEQYVRPLLPTFKTTLF